MELHNMIRVKSAALKPRFQFHIGWENQCMVHPHPAPVLQACSSPQLNTQRMGTPGQLIVHSEK